MIPVRPGAYWTRQRERIKASGLSGAKQKEVWIRHVVVPGITENYDDIEKMAEYLSKYSVISRVDILPFHKMGEYKWEELNLKYELSDVQPPKKNPY